MNKEDEVNIAVVAVDTVSVADREYTYIIPEGLEKNVSAGTIVEVYFGKNSKKTIKGLVLQIEKGIYSEKLKTIYSVSDLTIDNRSLDLIKYIRSKTFCTYFDALRLVCPDLSNVNGAPIYEKYYSVSDGSYIESFLNKNGTIKAGCIKQKEALDLISSGVCSLSALLKASVGKSTLLTLEKKGLIDVSLKETIRDPIHIDVKKDETPNILNDEQSSVYEDILKYSDSGKAYLLYGITGSGKTHIFIEMIENMINRGKGCILLLPEISLTLHIVQRLYGRFGNRIAIIHSGLSKGERGDQWRRVKSGDADIVIGTRSAVFAPVKNLGLIIIDEEQEHTYKSESSPRYNAKDIALYRVHSEKGLLLLSSATPSFESYYLATEHKIGYGKLSKRYNEKGLPKIVTVDMRNEIRQGNSSIISKYLAKEIEKNLSEKQQTILFLNRRGYAGFVQCLKCLRVERCPHCGIPMSYHTDKKIFMCHYCSYTIPAREFCPDCGARLRLSGMGTQKAEEQISELFPDARVLRMDADTVSLKGAREEILSSFEQGRYDILLGTQMITKGLDFSNVSLVGVLNCDSLLYNSDFRAYEKTFALITQVCGRAGRSNIVGRAVIQTYSPEHEVLQYAYKQDYEGFYDYQIPLRKAMNYPPFSNICQLVVIADDEKKAMTYANGFIETVINLNTEKYNDLKMIILNPTVTSVPMVDSRVRVRSIIKCKDKSIYRKLFSEAYLLFLKNNSKDDFNAFLDMNPQNIL